MSYLVNKKNITFFVKMFAQLEKSLYISTIINKLKHKTMTIFANTKNGQQVQIKLFGNLTMILNYIENYTGNDLGNDIILEDFITDFEETGVILEN